MGSVQFKRAIPVVALFVAAAAAACPVPAFAQLLGPTPYLSEANSPFLPDIVGGTVVLENFEDGALNTPGVVASAGTILSGSNVDSVDGDDGAIDGSGAAGQSFFVVTGGTGISFSFNAAALPGGVLPTRAGIVWTDGGDPVTFEAFDAVGTSLGTVTANHADGNFGSGTAEDRFYGVIHPAGISQINLRGAAGAGIEMDHLQYGQPVPEPAAAAALYLLAFAAAARRRTHARGRRA